MSNVTHLAVPLAAFLECVRKVGVCYQTHFTSRRLCKHTFLSLPLALHRFLLATSSNANNVWPIIHKHWGVMAGVRLCLNLYPCWMGPWWRPLEPAFPCDGKPCSFPLGDACDELSDGFMASRVEPAANARNGVVLFFFLLLLCKAHTDIILYYLIMYTKLIEWNAMLENAELFRLMPS